MFKRNDVIDIYPLSPMQDGMLFHYIIDKESGIYIRQMSYRISGDIDIRLFEKSFNQLIQRFDVLRTVFIYKSSEKPRQVVLRQRQTNIRYENLSHLEENEKNRYLEELKKREKKRGFNLSKDIPTRLAIFKRGERDYEITWDFHHIIVDGWCMGILIKDMLHIYKCLKNGTPLILPAPTPYKNYIKWLEKQDKKAAVNYWKRYLENYQSQAIIPWMAKEREGVTAENRQQIHGFQINKTWTRKFDCLAKEYNITLNSIFQTLWGILLQKYNNRNDVVFGTVVSGRPPGLPGVESMVGLFINTVPLRIKSESQQTFLELIKEVQQDLLRSKKYEYLPLVEIQGVTTLKQKLFNHITAFENYPLDDLTTYQNNENNPGFVVTGVEVKEQTNYDFNIAFIPKGRYFSVNFLYNSLAYERQTIERISHHLEKIIKQVTYDPGIDVNAIEIITDEEKKQVLYTFNDTKARYPVDKRIDELFEEQAARTPDRTAVIGEAQSSRCTALSAEVCCAPGSMRLTLTYNALNKKSHQLAYLLKDRSLQPGNIVGIMMERTVDMIACILGILKAGGAYLPIDPRFPQNRILSMLEDCDVPILLTETPVVEKQSFTALQNPGLVELEVQKTRTRQQITDFEGLPVPDRSLVNYEKFNDYIGQAMVRHCISMQATRGCPYKCAFCHKIWPKRHVVRSAQHIFAELKRYYDIGVRRFALVDDIFNLNIENSKRFFELIIENGLKLQLFFPNGIRADIMTKEYIDLMVKAGTVNMAFALETASSRLQKLIKKNVDLKKFRENLEYVCEKYPQVIVELFTMHGYPSETKEEAMITLNFIKSLKWVHFPYVFILRIFHNTDMEKLALENGITQKAINASQNSAFHELPETLPFDKSFTLKYQADFTNNYFLSKERLLHVLPYQMKSLTENEMVQKYNSYLPVPIKRLADLLELVEIKEDELGTVRLLAKDYMSVPNLNEKIKRCFPEKKPCENALRVLLLDLSQTFRSESDLLNDMVEPPLGLMYLMSYLNQELGDKVHGKIVKSSVDFDNYTEMKQILYEFKPDVIGIRTLTVSKDFFHKTTAMIRLWGIDAPIITGGPYATSDYTTILKDRNIDLVVLGEGEITFNEVIQKIIHNNGKLPDEEVLKEIDGIAFILGKEKSGKKFAREIVMVDELPRPLSDQSRENPLPVKQSTDLAYVIYTSGSTGKPKGTLTTHYNVNRVVRNTNYIHITENDRLLQLSNYAFDGSVFDIFGALLNGAPLVLMDREDLLSVDKLSYRIKREGITLFFVTTALFNALVDLQINCLKNIRKVLFGGERVSLEHSRKALKYLGKDRIIHVYGPTETTVYATYYFINQIEERSATIPIGKPIANTAVYILDKELKPVPLGINGEVYIGGYGLARGYLNRPELTAEKFIKQVTGAGDRCRWKNKKFLRGVQGGSFFKKRPSGRRRQKIYKTGDLARWLPDGNIQFMGRIDHQVKIRGFRIELGEIENQLLKHHEIKEAVVLSMEKEPGDKYLCAYIVPYSSDNFKEVSTVSSELRKYLLQTLPDYMIPSYFVPVEKLPLTSNGKLDKKSLPQPELKVECIAPLSEIEKKLVKIWGEVLGIGEDKIGINSNFFELGGHSLSANRVATKIHKTFNVKNSLAQIFETPTIKDLAQRIKEATHDEYFSIEASEKKEYYGLSSAHKRLYILHRLEFSTTSYNTTIAVTLAGHLEKEKMETAFRELIKRHESLRTFFEMLNDEPIQRIERNSEPPISYCQMSEEEVKGRVGKFIKPFDLNKPPLFRVELIIVGKEKYILIVDMHHIITDGTSIEILVKEFMALYTGEQLPPLRLQYKDYAVWQEKEKKRESMKQQEAFWLKQFEEDIPVLDLPTDFLRPRLQNFEGDRINFELSSQETGALKRLALEQNTTLYMVLLAIYNIFLAKITGQEDIIVGAPAAGRKHAELEHIIGMFVNTLAIRNFPRGNIPFSKFLAQVRERTLNVFDNQEFQFEELVDKLALNRDTSRNPLFDTMFSMQNIEVNSAEIPEVNLPELKLKPYKYQENTSKFDLTLTGTEDRDNLFFVFTYCSKLFKRETIERFIVYFKKIAAEVLKNTDRQIFDLEIISDNEKKEKISQYTRNLREDSETGTIQEKLCQSFQKHRDRIVIESGTFQISYQELESKSASISNWIINNKIKKGTFIGVYASDKVEIITVMLGILKAGCVVVPLDSMLNIKRIENLIRMTNIRIIFNDAENEKRLMIIRDNLGQTFETITVDQTLYTQGGKWDLGENEIRYNCDDQVYIYFTSGSTGIPKAIIGRNESLLQFIQWEIDTFAVESTTRVSQLTAVAFDAFLRDVFTPLCAGGTLCIPESFNPVMDRDGLVKWIDKNNIGLLHCVPTLFRLLNSRNLTPDHFGNLRYVLLSGEEIKPHELENWYERFDERIQLVNLYGPTETTLIKTCYFIRKADTDKNKIPIGKPLRDSQLILLDKKKNICAQGVVGEIYIRTPYSTFGYYSDPELNKKRFIRNPFNHDAADLIYKTGDLARELVNGDFEFIGRIDRQIKIRGIRVELGEIEVFLLKHKEIQEAVVLTRTDDVGEIHLCAYMVAGRELLISELRDYLSNHLPGYMIPSYFVQVDRMPLTPSGKVDWKRLPVPEPGAANGEYIAPANKTEEKLVEIWSEVLGTEKENISINSDFFELGGQSLKAIVMISRIHKELNAKIPLAEVFKTPWIKALVQYIHSKTPDKYTSIGAVEKREYYELSSAQKRLYILQQMELDNTAYNVPQFFPLAKKPDIKKLEQTSLQLIRRHESFRTSFHLVADEPFQKVHETVEFEIEYYNLHAPYTVRPASTIKNFIRAFDLSRAPLLRMGLIKIEENMYIFMRDMHHIISDGVSHEVLEKDFMAFYQGEELSSLRIQYKDFSQWQNSVQEQEKIKSQEEYWLKEYEGEIPVLDLRTDYPRPEWRSFAGANISFEIESEITRQLKHIAIQEGATLFMVLLAALNVLLVRYTKQEDIIIGSVTAGRGHPGLEDIIGYLLNTLAIRNYPNAYKSFKEFLQEVKINSLNAFENQDYPFQNLLEKLALERPTNRNPLFDVMFILENFEQNSWGELEKESNNLEFIFYEYENKTSKFDLTLYGWEKDEKLVLTIEYCTALFKDKTIQRMIKDYLKILESITQNLDIKIREIQLESKVKTLKKACLDVSFNI